VSDENIRVTARPRADGIDIERLSLALLEFVKSLPEAQRKRLAASGEKLITAAEREVKKPSKEGAA
jgi:hypothetical protein